MTAEVKYPISFKRPGRRFVLILHYNVSNSFLLFNAVKKYQLKAKCSKAKPYPLCLGDIAIL